MPVKLEYNTDVKAAGFSLSMSTRTKENWKEPHSGKPLKSNKGQQDSTVGAKRATLKNQQIDLN